eukprot:m.14234 g.14234  ORF g.14234 m.14234 type:complete len:659 (-) comp5042_c0_seq1:280-2256(-)
MASENLVSLELLTGLGMPSKKAEEVVQGQASGKGKKLAQMIASLVKIASEANEGKPITGNQGKALLQAAEKFKDTVSEEARTLFVKYIFAAEDESILAIPKTNAAINFLSKAKDPVSEEAFRAAAGVGVVVSAELVGKEVRDLVEAHKDEVIKNGYKFQGNMRGMLKRNQKLTFADNEDVTKALDTEFKAILGEANESNTKKTKNKAPKKQKVPETKEPEESISAEKDNLTEEDKRELLTKVAVEFNLDVGTVLKKFMGSGEDAGDDEEKEQQINPITVDTGDEAIDYDRLVKQFGTEKITPDLIERFEKLTGKRAHHLLRRGIFFSHRDLDKALDAYEAGTPFYLYTGRGPSSESMHIGHLIPFMFTRYLQEAFGCYLVIQMTDDEKYLWKDLTLPQLEYQLRKNVQDIIAYGFDRHKTFIFSDMKYMGGKFYENVLLVEKRITGNQAIKALGLSTLDNIGKFSFSAIQATPSFSSSFPHMFGEDSSSQCLIPCAIDQDVYFRMTRDIAPRLGYKKPAVVHSSFLPAMGGPSSKMSSSTGAEKTIFLTDTPKEIHDKVHRYAYSGAPQTLKELKEHGANLDLDVSYQYLRFFLDDDEKLGEIGGKYSKGEITTADVKNELVKVLQDLIKKHQEIKAKTTDDEIDFFMNTDPTRFHLK